MSRRKKQRITKNSTDSLMKKICAIQSQLGDAVLIRIGVKNDGKVVDIVSTENLFHKKIRSFGEETGESDKEIDVEVPIPYYVG